MSEALGLQVQTTSVELFSKLIPVPRPKLVRNGPRRDGNCRPPFQTVIIF